MTDEPLRAQEETIMDGKIEELERRVADLEAQLALVISLYMAEPYLRVDIMKAIEQAQGEKQTAVTDLLNAAQARAAQNE